MKIRLNSFQLIFSYIQIKINIFRNGKFQHWNYNYFYWYSYECVFTFFSIFHSKHRIKQLDEQIEIAKKNNLPINKNLTEMLESLLFQSSFGFWINHWKIKFYIDYYNQNKLTPIMLKLLNKRNYLLIDSTNKILITQITKTHKLMYYFN